MPEVGRDDVWVRQDGRVVEFWDGGDPAGRAVVMHPGTPASRLLGRWGHDAAVAAGVRLVSISRPGYGGSTPTRAPSLMATGRDTAEFSAWLGLEEYAVMGISGGGPFAVATAIADPDAVRALAVVGGVGPWTLLDEPTEAERVDREYLAMFDAGDTTGAWEGLSRLAEQEMGGWRSLDDDALVDAILDEPQSPLAHDDAYRALWASNMTVVLSCLDGYVTDNLAWGGTWDVDPADVAAPTVLWDADGDGARHVRWYADRIAGSELVIFPGEGHVDVCDLHWPEVLAGLLRVWV
jgi:pimeloyl-ACP methyl ester carboxylesterase